MTQLLLMGATVAVFAGIGLAETGAIVGRILDDSTGKLVAARIYLTDGEGKPYFVKNEDGEPLPFHDNTDGDTRIREAYSLTAAEPFHAELPAGEYTLTIERGKEYLPLTRTLTCVAGQTREYSFRLLRLFDLNKLGWYSADCHVHTPLEQLPAAMLADDVNVAFPITAWTISDQQPPANLRGTHPVPEKGELVTIDPTHVYWNLNTEYEIFRVNDVAHTLGAFLILGHTTPFTQLGPPVTEIARVAHEQGAVLDWEKHSWPWSNMLVPVAGIDVIQLTDNSMWRQATINTHLWGRQPPPWLPDPLKSVRAFVDYGFDIYYAVLNCGFNLRVSGGTANGVHPVPMGHSRVYAHVDGDFSYEKWMEAFKAGRSFCTNGPALLMSVDGKPPGTRVALKPGENKKVAVNLEVYTTGTLATVEVIVNGKVIPVAAGPPERGMSGHRGRRRIQVDVEGTTWIAARCFDDMPEHNPRYAHTSPVWFDDPTRPVRPTAAQIDYLIGDVERQIERGKDVLSSEAMAEYEQAVKMYRAIKQRSDAGK